MNMDKLASKWNKFLEAGWLEMDQRCLGRQKIHGWNMLGIALNTQGRQQQQQQL